MVNKRKYKVRKFFNIEKTISHNTDSLTPGFEFDYITRTSLNRGIHSTTGFIDSESINDKGTFSLGLLQMDFFYREKPWYAGQFVRRIVCKEKYSKKVCLYFEVLLNSLSPFLLSKLVRDVDDAFLNLEIELPINENNEIAFDYMEKQIQDLTEDKLQVLRQNLATMNLDNCELNPDDKRILSYKPLMHRFNIIDVFDVSNTHNILSTDIKEQGIYPYVTASSENNSIDSYITYDLHYIEKGNCAFIGGKTMTVTYQKDDFFSNDSHNLVLRLKNSNMESEEVYLYIISALEQSLKYKYHWGDSISKAKIKKDVLMLPVKESNDTNHIYTVDDIDYDYMKKYIAAIEKGTVNKLNNKEILANI